VGAGRKLIFDFLKKKKGKKSWHALCLRSEDIGNIITRMINNDDEMIMNKRENKMASFSLLYRLVHFV
jgi:hypothetical protein